MYQYKVIRVELSNIGFRAKPQQDYRNIIDQYAMDGWRLVQIFAPPIFGQGTASFYDLIFEKESK